MATKSDSRNNEDEALQSTDLNRRLLSAFPLLCIFMHDNELERGWRLAFGASNAIFALPTPSPVFRRLFSFLTPPIARNNAADGTPALRRRFERR